MTNNFECYYFIKSSIESDQNHSHPFACVCLQGNKEGEDWKFNRGISICSPKDSFKKKVGRMKAKAALANGSNKTAYIRNDYLFKQVSDIYWLANRLDLHVPNNTQIIGKKGTVINNEYKKAEFNLPYSSLTEKEQDIVKGFVEG